MGAGGTNYWRRVLIGRRSLQRLPAAIESHSFGAKKAGVAIKSGACAHEMGRRKHCRSHRDRERTELGEGGRERKLICSQCWPTRARRGRRVASVARESESRSASLQLVRGERRRL